MFDAVVAEIGQLLAVEAAVLNRYEPDGTATTVVGSWARTGAEWAFPSEPAGQLGGRNVSTLVRATGRAARIDDYADAAGEWPPILLASGACAPPSGYRSWSRAACGAT